MPELALLCLLLLQTRVHGFGISGGDSLNHQDITERAILNVTVQVCRAVALAEGKDFTFPVRIKFTQLQLFFPLYIVI